MIHTPIGSVKYVPLLLKQVKQLESAADWNGDETKRKYFQAKRLRFQSMIDNNEMWEPDF